MRARRPARDQGDRRLPGREWPAPLEPIIHTPPRPAARAPDDVPAMCGDERQRRRGQAEQPSGVEVGLAVRLVCLDLVEGDHTLHTV